MDQQQSKIVDAQLQTMFIVERTLGAVTKAGGSGGMVQLGWKWIMVIRVYPRLLVQEAW